MKILLAIKSLNVPGGGAERVLVDVANGMSARGHEVQVLTFDSPGLPAFYPLSPDVPCIQLGLGEPGQPTPRTRFLRSLAGVRRRILEADADLVVAFMHSTYVPLSLALLGSGVRLVVSEHVNATHYRTRPLQRALVRLADQMALAKTVPSAPLRASHPPALRDKVFVLPNAIDLAAFAHVQALAPHKPPIVLSVGRFMEEKNHVDLIHAFAQLAPAFPDWNLKIVGEGVLRPQLEALIERLDMGARIQMPGVSRDIASEYAAASVVALPSLYESFGMVAAEALASGRPLIAFDSCEGIAEMVRNEVDGLLVPAAGDRVASLAAGLHRLMSDQALRTRLATNAPESVRRFALRGVLDTWESLFMKLYEHRKRWAT